MSGDEANLQKPLSVETDVLGIVREVLQRPDLEPRRSLTAADVPGWDSIKMVDIILALEDAFAIRFPVRVLTGLRDLGGLIDAVEAQLRWGGR